MNPFTYGEKDWLEAFDTAEEFEFDEINSEENGGELARLVAELYTLDSVGNDAGKLHTALHVASAHLGEFDQKFLERVLSSYDGQTVDELEQVARDHIKETWLGFPADTVGDMEKFAVTYALGAHLRWAKDSAGGTLYVFDTNKW